MNLKMQSLRKKQSRNSFLKYLCLAALILLSYLAVTRIPALYADGLSVNDWIEILMLFLSGDALIYLERGFSSKENRRPHDWNSRGGSLHAFSFDNRVCPVCGTRLILATDVEGSIHPVAPGTSQSESEPGFYCTRCKALYSPDACIQRLFQSSRIRAWSGKGPAPRPAAANAYRISSLYLRKHALVCFIALIAFIYSLYVFHRNPLHLLFPFFLSYFFFISFLNLLNYCSMRYSILDQGVLVRSLWSISLYAYDDCVCLIRYQEDGAVSSYGLITSKENLLISPVIESFEDMVIHLRKACADNAIPEFF